MISERNMNGTNDRAIDFRIFKEVDSHEVAYPAGSVILTPGETSRMMYIVKEGVVSVQIHNMTVENISEGSIFGEMGIVDPQPQFLKLISTTPTFALRVMRILARRARAMNARLLENGAMDSEQFEPAE